MERYTYLNADGSVNRTVKRLSGPKKRFAQYAPNGKPGVNGCPPVIYNLPAVLKAIREDKTVWIVEGEKDADTMIELGHAATTNPQGAGQWKKEHTEYLTGAKRVHIVMDDDDPGRDHGRRVAESLRRAGIESRLFLPAVGKDVTDHVDAGKAISDLVPAGPAKPTTAASNGSQIASDRSHTGKAGHPPAAFQLALDRLADYAKVSGLPAPRKTGEDRYEVCCPAHDDRSPSLGIQVGDKQPVVVNCQAGCSLADIALALGINPKEFSTQINDADRLLQQTLERMRAQQQAREILADENSPHIELREWSPYEYMEATLPKIEFTIEKLHPTGSNTLLIARGKAGKTTMLINLQRSLADGMPFLDHFPVRQPQGRIAFLEFEMIEEMFRTWVVENGIDNLNKIVAPQHLRGFASPFATKQGREKLIDWLGRNDVEVLIIDPIARAWQGHVENENDNSQIAHFTNILDEVKLESGVTDLVIATHTGRTEYAEDDEHARGATRLEDWPDSLWYYVKNKEGMRTLRAMGRSIELPAIAVEYELPTHRVFTTGRTRQAAQDDVGVEAAVAAMYDLAGGDEEVTTRMIRDGMAGSGQDKHRWILNAIERGYIDRYKGKGRAQLHRLTPAGEQFHNRKVELRKEDDA